MLGVTLFPIRETLCSMQRVEAGCPKENEEMWSFSNQAYKGPNVTFPLFYKANKETHFLWNSLSVLYKVCAEVKANSGAS